MNTLQVLVLSVAGAGIGSATWWHGFGMSVAETWFAAYLLTAAFASAAVMSVASIRYSTTTETDY